MIERKAFRRHLTISLKPGKPIQIRAGYGTPMRQIEKLLLEKEKWIEKNMFEFEKLAQKFPEKKLKPSEAFPFLGENLSLRMVPTPLRQVFFSKHQNFLHMHLPESLWQECLQVEKDLRDFFPHLKEFYRREAHKVILDRVQIWSQKMELFPRALKLRNQKTRWGSCTSKGSIQINWRLIGAPLEVIDYILIHELAHLKHMNHSEDFWKLVEQHCPNYELSEEWLKENHGSLDFLLQT